MDRVGGDRAERRDVVPAQLRVRVTTRPRYACRRCEEGVHQAPAPARIVAGGLPTEATLAHVLVSKYGDGLPLYRQCQILARGGIHLDRATLCDWARQTCWWLRPRHELVLAHVVGHARVFADDTPLPTLAPGRGRTRDGRIWAYAAEALLRIGALYAIEREIRGRHAEERQAVRQERSAPLVRDLRLWLDAQLGRVSQGSALAVAIRYGLRHWDGLCRFLDDGALELDTNSVEREIRPVVVTRKAALFAGSEGGGETWAIATTLIRTAIINGVNPQAWLTDVLERMVRGEVRSTELATLLPWAWRHAGTAAAAA
jgi:transposase